MLKFIAYLLILNVGIDHVRATSCHELHQSQLRSLNERMNQMIDTISSLLPKPLKKPNIPVPPAITPTADYLTSAPSYETTYTSPPTYTSLPQTPQIMYVTPSFTPTPPTVISPLPFQPNAMPLPAYYSPVETGLPVDYTFSSTSNLLPKFSKSYYQYEIMPNPVQNPPIPYSNIQQYASDYSPLPLPEYPLAAPVYPNMHPFSPTMPYLPLPVYTIQPPRHTS